MKNQYWMIRASNQVNLDDHLSEILSPTYPDVLMSASRASLILLATSSTVSILPCLSHVTLPLEMRAM